MKELLTLRNEWFREIDKAGGAADVWGTWHPVDNRRHPKTRKSIRGAHAVGATVIQSIEMEIIAPIFDVTSKHGASDQFTIALFQHDGATVSFQSKGEKRARAERRLKEAVAARARQLGVTTTLEFTDLVGGEP